MTGARHLYVHLPFCAHRCGYCDFVTVVGRQGQHGAYVDALLTELSLARAAGELAQQRIRVAVVLARPGHDRDEIAVTAPRRTERQVDVEVPHGIACDAVKRPWRLCRTRPGLLHH